MSYIMKLFRHPQDEWVSQFSGIGHLSAASIAAGAVTLTMWKASFAIIPIVLVAFFTFAAVAIILILLICPHADLSMQPTINNGSYTLNQPIIFPRSPKTFKHGEVISARVPEVDKHHLSKRVIGLPGEEIAFIDGKTYIDGKKLDEPYLPNDVHTLFDCRSITDSELATFTRGCISYHDNSYFIAPGYVFVMGDNRSQSYDSRKFGAIPLKSIKSKTKAVTWPLRDMKRL